MDLKDQIIVDINDIYGDTSRAPEETLEIMEEIKAAVQMNIDALQEDLK